MKGTTRITICRLAARWAILILLLLPVLTLLVMCHLLGVSLSEGLAVGEYAGFTILYLIMTYVSHLPLFALLALYSRFVKRRYYKKVAAVYSLLFIGFVLSGYYFYRVAFPDSHNLPILPRLIPSVVYVIVLAFLAQGVTAPVKQSRQNSE